MPLETRCCLKGQCDSTGSVQYAPVAISFVTAPGAHRIQEWQIKTKAVTDAAKTKLTLKNLKKGKTYYVSICPYTKVSNKVTDTEETICGDWTKTKKAKIKR